MTGKRQKPGRNESAKAAAERELRSVLAGIADQPGGPDALLKMAVEMILPIEEKVRRENPAHPTLAVIDDWRRRGLI
jgi:hypothetical protein